jgi:hypothetical protein
LGHFSNDAISLIGFPGEIFMQIVEMMILPLIISSVISGKAHHINVFHVLNPFHSTCSATSDRRWPCWNLYCPLLSNNNLSFDICKILLLPTFLWIICNINERSIRQESFSCRLSIPGTLNWSTVSGKALSMTQLFPLWTLFLIKLGT